MIIKDLNHVLSVLKEAIRVRHILCHEVAAFLGLKRDEALSMLECGYQFTHAVSWLVAEELHPNAPLTQSEMTAAAWTDATARRT